MLLEIKDLYGGYGSGDVVKGVSCHADQGEVLCLVGPNGCGKTTLFRLILGSIPASAGTITIDGRDARTMSPKELANLIAYIPQYHTPIFDYTVLDVVIMGRASHFSAFDTPKAIDREAAFDALKKVNAVHLANRKYTSLSGGQRQLILIARAICQSARIFVMDEPAANLDYANHQLLMDVISDLAGKGYCIIMSTHSPEHPASVGTKVLLMKEGRVAGFGSPKQIITPENLENVYGIEMDVVTIHDRYGAERTICLPVKNTGQLTKPTDQSPPSARHTFLTGPKGVGKSTLIRKYLDQHTGKTGGFFTVRTDSFLKTGFSVHLLPVDGSAVPNQDNLLFVCEKADDGTAERFDALGTRALTMASDSSLIVMDELGPHEAAARRFRQAVLNTLDGNIPVLGVLQSPAESFWPDIVSRPDVKIIEITEENRDQQFSLK